jgi:AbrB family looped-hinge helix DNA binding protein
MDTCNNPHKAKCHGVVTVGTKGQIVIPASARLKLDIKTGDKLLILEPMKKGMLAMCKIEDIEVMLAGLTEQLTNIRKTIDEVKE